MFYPENMCFLLSELYVFKLDLELFLFIGFVVFIGVVLPTMLLWFQFVRLAGEFADITLFLSLSFVLLD